MHHSTEPPSMKADTQHAHLSLTPTWKKIGSTLQGTWKVRDCSHGLISRPSCCSVPLSVLSVLSVPKEKVFGVAHSPMENE